MCYFIGARTFLKKKSLMGEIGDKKSSVNAKKKFKGLNYHNFHIFDHKLILKQTDI